jgi:hypothetical protein
MLSETMPAIRQKIEMCFDPDVYWARKSRPSKDERERISLFMTTGNARSYVRFLNVLSNHRFMPLSFFEAQASRYLEFYQEMD